MLLCGGCTTASSITWQLDFPVHHALAVPICFFTYTYYLYNVRTGAYGCFWDSRSLVQTLTPAFTATNARTIHSAGRHYQSPADSNSGQNTDIRALLTIRHGDSRFGDHDNNCQFSVAEDCGTCRSLASLSSPQVTIWATHSQSYPRLGDKFVFVFAMAIIQPASWSRLVPRGGISPDLLSP